MIKSDEEPKLLSFPNVLRRLSIAVAVFIFLMPPLGYWFISYTNNSEQLQQSAELISHAISRMAYMYPNEWDLQASRLEHLVQEFRPRNIEVNVGVWDSEDHSIVADQGQRFKLPILREALILGRDGIAGKITLEKSLVLTAYNTTAIGLICLLVAAVFLSAINRYSIRGLQKATADIHQAHADLQKQQMYLDAILSSSKNVAIAASDRNWVTQYFNHAAEQLFDCSSGEALGSPLYELHDELKAAIGGTHPPGQLLGNNAELNFTISDERNGQKRYIEARVSAIVDTEYTLSGYTLMCTDVTTQRKASELIYYQATYDSLTTLSNRRVFKDQLRKALVSAKRHGQLGAVLFFDLDNFKHINDSLGHSVGDAVLQEVAKRLKSSVREEDVVARLGGDEFVVLLHELSGETEEAINKAQKLADKVRQALSVPYVIELHTLHITASIGISVFPSGEDELEDIMRQADTAMYRAKEAGRNTAKFFLPSMQRASEKRLQELGDLRQGIDGSEFLPFFQPLIDANGTLIGAEALIRWQHPKRGLVPPHEFITSAEESGLILELDRIVLKSALMTLRSWLSQNMISPSFRMSVNISPQQFKQADFVPKVEHILGHAGIAPTNLTLEMTEGVLLDNIESATAKILALKKIGVRFSIDDFGTGYSSLSYLKRLPIDEIKIDRSFVHDVLLDDSDAALVEAIVNLSSRLELDTVAEGVETEAQYKYLQQLGCKSYQGYFFAKPLHREAFQSFLISQKSMAG